VLAWLSLAWAAAAQPVTAAPRAAVPVEDGTSLDPMAANALRPPLDVRTLPSGLRVVLDPRPGTGTVTLCSVYDVGMATETEAELGFTRIAAGWLGDLDRAAAVVAERGGVTETSVGLDRTSFCTTVPARELALGVWAEARRLHPWQLTPERLEAARRRAERAAHPPAPDGARLRGEARLEGLALRGALRTERSAVASVRGVSSAQRDQVERFVRAGFRPERGVLVVTGAFDPTALLTALGQALPPAPARGPAPRGAGVGAPARQLSERFSSLREEERTTPLVLFGWATPAHGSADQTALELAAALLAGGPGTPLYDGLVVRAGHARSVRAFTTEHRGEGLLVIEVELAARAPLLAVETAVTLALRRLAAAGPTTVELARARAARLGELLVRLDGGPSRALELAGRELVTGELGRLGQEPERYRAVTAADVRRVVAAHLTDTRRSVVEVYPPGWPTGGPARAARSYHLVEPGETLIGIAARYGVTVDALTKENSIQRSKPIFPGQKLRLPPGSKDRQRATPSAAPPGARGKDAAPRLYAVRKGDTLGAIARRHGVTTTALARANGLDPKRPLRIGQKLTIPSAAPVPSAGAKDGAKPGAKDDAKPTTKDDAKPTTKDDAKRSTSAAPSSGTKEGAKPGAKDGAKPGPKDGAKPGAAAPASAPAAPAPRIHVVRSGETLSGIAKRYGVTTTALARANGLDPKRPIRPGQKLVIPE